MIDEKNQVRRYIAEYSEETEGLIAEYELDSFDLVKFQNEFNEKSGNPMFDCYPIMRTNAKFLQAYLQVEMKWDFVGKSYFLESRSV